jgi:multiple sugar transport system permease protein
MSDLSLSQTETELAAGARLRRKRGLVNFGIDAFLMLFGLFMILPLILLVANAFKTPQEMLSWPPSIIPANPTLANFEAVLGDTPLLRWIFNSFAFAVLSALAILCTSTIAGYVLAKFPSRTMSAIFAVILATAIVPFEVYMIPLYFTAQSLGILNSLWGLLLGYLVMSFGIFLIRQNVMHSIPDELLEAARIDGAGEIWIFIRIVVPLLRGALGALFVLAFFQAWTAFAWPLIVATTTTSYTIEVGLALFQTGFTVDLGRLSAASAIVLVPSVTLFVLLRRNFVQGVASTGLKE